MSASVKTGEGLRALLGFFLLTRIKEKKPKTRQNPSPPFTHTLIGAADGRHHHLD